VGQDIDMDWVVDAGLESMRPWDLAFLAAERRQSLATAEGRGFVYKGDEPQSGERIFRRCRGLWLWIHILPIRSISASVLIRVSYFDANGSKDTT
jgi:hypothetical protein